MSRQLDIDREVRETKRRDELVKALEFGIVGGLEHVGIDLVGLSIRYDTFNCLLTLKAEINDKRYVSFVGSDTMINCILKAYGDSACGALKWREDRYHTK